MMAVRMTRVRPEPVAAREAAAPMEEKAEEGQEDCSWQLILAAHCCGFLLYCIFFGVLQAEKSIEEKF